MYQAAEFDSNDLAALRPQPWLEERVRNCVDGIPAIVLGGSQNALSVARSLSHHRVFVVAINYPHEAIRFSRCASYIRAAGPSPASWERFLISQSSDSLQGAVLLACSDEAITIINDNYDLLRCKFLLEETTPAARRALMNKYLSYQKAAEAGIPTVRYNLVKWSDTLESILLTQSFPVILKPVYSPHSRAIRLKAAVVRSSEELASVLSIAASNRVDVVLMDYIPGGDDRLCSYFTYLDESGNPLVHLTKRVRRRYPDHGDGTYHYTEWIPEVAALGLRFFRSLNYRGLGNIEFKWDERDNTYKMIEANARFAASDPLLVRSGVNLALVAYSRIVNQPQAPILTYTKSLVLWRPLEDTCAAWKLYWRGQLRLLDWFNQIISARVFPFFKWRDPIPAIMTLCHRLRAALRF